MSTTMQSYELDRLFDLFLFFYIHQNVQIQQHYLPAYFYDRDAMLSFLCLDCTIAIHSPVGMIPAYSQLSALRLRDFLQHDIVFVLVGMREHDEQEAGAIHIDSD